MTNKYTPSKEKYQRGVQALRNLRIVYLKRERKMSFGEIRDELLEQGEDLSTQQIASVYHNWKDVRFRWEDDKVIIH